MTRAWHEGLSPSRGKYGLHLNKELNNAIVWYYKLRKHVCTLKMVQKMGTKHLLHRQSKINKVRTHSLPRIHTHMCARTNTYIHTQRKQYKHRKRTETHIHTSVLLICLGMLHLWTHVSTTTAPLRSTCTEGNTHMCTHTRIHTLVCAPDATLLKSRHVHRTGDR